MRLTLERARELAVLGQLLDAARPAGILDVVRGLGKLQLDPTSAVAPSEQLVLWSRLGGYDPARLRQLLEDEHELFEYWAHILPASDFAVHRETMRRFPRGDYARPTYVRGWLADNAAFRRYVLAELRRRGPLRSRELEDRAAVPWRSGGWNDGKNVTMMLDTLWFRGEITIVARDGRQRVWDLSQRHLPVGEPRLTRAECARRLLAGQLRARGVAAPDEFGFAFDGRPPGWEQALRALVRDGDVVQVQIDGLAGLRYADARLLEQPFAGRTAILSPFDQLVANRGRAEALFGFEFRLEIYVPQAKRRWGYYVLPVLHGSRLVARLDVVADREAGVLRLHRVHVEPGVGGRPAASVGQEARSLAAWLGLGGVAVGEAPRGWRRALEG
jgi:uncharacterized protein YcaQ